MSDGEIDRIEQSETEYGYIDRIPVRNLWLLMLYASNLFRELEKAQRSVESNPDDIPDLIAEILCRRVEHRIQRNLSRSYMPYKAVLGRVRGRIDLFETEKRNLLSLGKIACRFDELAIDTVRNRYVRAALEKMSGVVRRKDLAYRCRSLAYRLRCMGVTGKCPERSEISMEQYGRHDADDKQMMAATELAFNLALPTEMTGKKYLSSPDRKVTWVRNLYEKGVAGLYDAVLSVKGWKVRAGKYMNWPIQDKSAGIERIFPSMQTDIILDNPENKHRFVIDTKFTSILIKGKYQVKRLRTAYIYQIYAYLRSQEGNGDHLAENATGILLHPSIEEMIDEYVVIQNHKIRFVTIDLIKPPKEIREQLLHIVEHPC